MKITAGNKQSRFRHYVGAPKRLLRWARDFYVDSMVSFDGRVSSANVMACPATHVSQPPKSFGGRSFGEAREEDENLEELYRSISKKHGWSSVEFGANGGRQSVSVCSAMDRSYSVALGRIGTIDDDEPCDFQEHVIKKSEILLPRSRSHALAKKNGYFY